MTRTLAVLLLAAGLLTIALAAAADVYLSAHTPIPAWARD